MANRWQGKAQVFIVFTEEAHPKGENIGKYNMLAEMMRMADQDLDNVTSPDEFMGPEAAFGPLDNNHDGVIQRHELLSAGKVAQFAEVVAPTTPEDRVALARRYRADIPGDIPVLLDDMQHSARTAFGAMDNSAFVIDAKGEVSHRFMWAYVPDIDKAVAGLLGVDVPPPSLPRLDWQVLASDLARAQTAARPLLVHFTTPGCHACKTMKEGVLADADVQAAMGRYEVVEAGLEHDPNWGLFEALGLSGTPAFVVVDPIGAPIADQPGASGPRARSKLQGAQDKARFLQFLGG